jgi:hypothetical protein
MKTKRKIRIVKVSKTLGHSFDLAVYIKNVIYRFSIIR